jgi:hypothetical protein
MTCSLTESVLPILSFRLLFTYSLEIPNRIVPTAIFDAIRLEEKNENNFLKEKNYIFILFTIKMLI